MTHKVFIDGEVGTTGLQIRERLETRADIELVQIEMDRRKDLDARLAAFAAADVAILCLPDAAVLEIVPHLAGSDTRLIDASTAHRVHDDWVFGFAELEADRADRIASAARVSNPGCYSTAAIAMLRPMTDAGVIAANEDVHINAISGYTGGGKSLIAEYESGQAPAHFSYGLVQNHKHVPEMMAYGGLLKAPVFSPAVGNFAQGMLVQIPLPGGSLSVAEAEQILRDRYDGSDFVRVVAAGDVGDRIDPQQLNGTNYLDLCVTGTPDGARVVLNAVLDNLGKGASGAAVQNLNLMLGQNAGLGL